MPRFAFGKRKSTAESENDIAAPSFRVLDRSEVAEGNGKSFDGGVRLSAKTHTLPKTTVSDISVEDNIFADFKPKNRYVFYRFSLHWACGCSGRTCHSYCLFNFPHGLPI